MSPNKPKVPIAPILIMALPLLSIIFASPLSEKLWPDPHPPAAASPLKSRQFIAALDHASHMRSVFLFQSFIGVTIVCGAIACLVALRTYRSGNNA